MTWTIAQRTIAADLVPRLLNLALEQNMIGTKYKTFWRRFWAGWVDSLAFLPVQIGSHYIWKYHEHVPLWLLAVWNFIPSLIWYGYNI